MRQDVELIRPEPQHVPELGRICYSPYTMPLRAAWARMLAATFSSKESLLLSSYS
jgi:hypothetical protein